MDTEIPRRSEARTKTVLIADDEATLRRLVNATIASDDYRVLEAADGNEAWAVITRERPAVVLLDVMMPGRSGLEVARAIRQDPSLANTKIIMLTAKSQQTDVAAGLAAGADLYLTKPFSPFELLTAVENAAGVD
jgi:CheY-like chemotaxis protein